MAVEKIEPRIYERFRQLRDLVALGRMEEALAYQALAKAHIVARPEALKKRLQDIIRHTCAAFQEKDESRRIEKLAGVPFIQVLAARPDYGEKIFGQFMRHGLVTLGTPFPQNALEWAQVFNQANLARLDPKDFGVLEKFFAQMLGRPEFFLREYLLQYVTRAPKALLKEINYISEKFPAYAEESWLSWMLQSLYYHLAPEAKHLKLRLPFRLKLLEEGERETFQK